MRRQENNNDCDLFALAVATSLNDLQDPCHLQLHSMRQFQTVPAGGTSDMSLSISEEVNEDCSDKIYCHLLTNCLYVSSGVSLVLLDNNPIFQRKIWLSCG